MDGLIRLRRWQQRPPPQPMPPRDPWFVPWSTSLRAASVRGMRDVTFALEIDEGTEPLGVLYRKAENYKRTYVGGMHQRDPAGQAAMPTVAWDTILCPTNTPADREARKYFFPVPLVVVPSAQRLANVFAVWQRGWPGSEVRMTSWEHINQQGSIVEAPYLNQHRQWVDWLGYPHPSYAGSIPKPSI